MGDGSGQLETTDTAGETAVDAAGVEADGAPEGEGHAGEPGGGGGDELEQLEQDIGELVDRVKEAETSARGAARETEGGREADREDDRGNGVGFDDDDFAPIESVTEDDAGGAVAERSEQTQTQAGGIDGGGAGGDEDWADRGSAVTEQLAQSASSALESVTVDGDNASEPGPDEPTIEQVDEQAAAEADDAIREAGTGGDGSRADDAGADDDDFAPVDAGELVNDGGGGGGTSAKGSGPLLSGQVFGDDSDVPETVEAEEAEEPVPADSGADDDDPAAGAAEQSGGSSKGGELRDVTADVVDGVATGESASVGGGVLGKIAAVCEPARVKLAAVHAKMSPELRQTVAYIGIGSAFWALVLWVLVLVMWTGGEPEGEPGPGLVRNEEEAAALREMQEERAQEAQEAWDAEVERKRMEREAKLTEEAIKASAEQ